jgi:hypothetical protein
MIYVIRSGKEYGCPGLKSKMSIRPSSRPSPRGEGAKRIEIADGRLANEPTRWVEPFPRGGNGKGG